MNKTVVTKVWIFQDRARAGCPTARRGRLKPCPDKPIYEMASKYVIDNDLLFEHHYYSHPIDGCSYLAIDCRSSIYIHLQHRFEDVELESPGNFSTDPAETKMRFAIVNLNTARASSDILNSWKEIAAYLKRDIRTVQRWEADLADPCFFGFLILCQRFDYYTWFRVAVIAT